MYNVSEAYMLRPSSLMAHGLIFFHSDHERRLVQKTCNFSNFTDERVLIKGMNIVSNPSVAIKRIAKRQTIHFRSNVVKALPLVIKIL